MTSPAGKVDLKKDLADYAAKRGRFDLVDVPPRQYLMIDGHGDPNTSPLYADALATLFPLAYTLKFASKRSGRDFVVMPLEGLWWADDMSAFTTHRDKLAWSWTMMILQPEWIDQALFSEAIEVIRAKQSATKPAPRRLDQVRMASLAEGACMQTLHLGSYDDEAPVLAAMHDHIEESGLTLTGLHHEIYFSDPRKVAPEKMRTLLRQPVAPPT